MRDVFTLIPTDEEAKVVKVPGKLYIAGEYAILEPGHSAILVAVDAFLQVTIGPADFESDTLCQVDSPSLDESPFMFGSHAFDPKWAYVHSALHTFNALLEELGLTWRPCHLTITSELSDASGQKYGLGSSGTVVIALLKALSLWHGLAWSKRQSIFKLATMASIRVSDKGSFGDLAASTYGGWLKYTSFDRQWLQALVAAKRPLLDILQQEWPYLQLQPFEASDHVQLAIGWTQSPASTERLVRQYEKNKTAYDPLLLHNEAMITRLFQGLRTGDFETIRVAIEEARRILGEIAALQNITIETPALRPLIEEARALEWAAKSSGAGGGDCGIAIGVQTHHKESLLKKWQEIGIQPLPFHVTKTH